MKPWEKYADPGAGPWAKYGQPKEDVSAAFARGEASNLIPGQPALPPEQGNPEGLTDKLIALPDAALTMASSVPASFAGNIAGAARTMTSGKFGSPEGIAEGAKRAEEVTGKYTHQPFNESSRAIVEGVGDVVNKSGIAGLNPAVPLGAEGAAIRNLPKNVRGAIADSPEASLLKRGVANMQPVNENTRALARVAQERFGINLRPDMLSDSRLMRVIGDTLEGVPFAGSKVEQRQMAFNSALGKLIGAEDAKRLTPDVFDKAMTRSGETIGEIAKKTNIPLFDMESGSGEFDNQLTAFMAKISKRETPDVAKVVKGYVDDIREKAVDGIVPGETFRRINSEIGRQARRTTNGDLKFALGDLQDIMHDALAGNVSAEDLARFQEARTQYAIGKTIEPLVAKSKNGDISPGGLMGAVTSDAEKKSMMARNKGKDLGTLARIGQAFLKEPGSSFTGERGLAYLLLGGGLHYEPHSAAALYGAANLYNRVGPGIARRMTSKAIAPSSAEVLGSEAP